MLRVPLLLAIASFAACATPDVRVATPAESADYFAQGLPRPKQRFTPSYPFQAALDGTQGTVLLKFSISGAGRPTSIEVLESEPPGIFDDASIASVERWIYHPVVAEGHPVELSGKRFRYVFEVAPCGEPRAIAKKYEDETVLVCAEILHRE